MWFVLIQYDIWFRFQYEIWTFIGSTYSQRLQNQNIDNLHDIVWAPNRCSALRISDPGKCAMDLAPGIFMFISLDEIHVICRFND